MVSWTSTPPSLPILLYSFPLATVQTELHGLKAEPQCEHTLSSVSSVTLGAGYQGENGPQQYLGQSATPEVTIRLVNS